jgi:MFS family permease
MSRLDFMLRALRYRNYRLFFGGQIVSLVGTWMTQIAMTWLVYRLTGSALLLGVVGFAGQIPGFLLGPVAGVLIDRWPRHRLLVVTQILAMLQSLALAVLALTGLIQVWHILVLIAFQGLVNAFDMPARQSFVIELVESKEDLSNAIALNSTMFNMARLLGPAMGGILVAAVGEGWCFLLDGLSYIAVIGALLMMRLQPHERKPGKAQPLKELKEGLAYVAGSPPIRAILILMAWMSLVGMPYGVLMPVIAKQTLHGGPGTMGFLMAASGSGALAAALALAARKSIRGLGKLIPFCIAGFGLGLVAFSQSRVLWLSMLALFVMGFAMMQQNASGNTILQTIVEDDKRGRVMSFYTMSFMGMAPFGSLWAGALANRIGAPSTLLVCGAGCLAAALWFRFQYPALRETVLPIYIRMGIAPEIAEGLNNAAQLTKPPTEQA